MIYALAGYFLFIMLYTIYSVVAIYHLRRFGFVGDLSKKVIYIYLFLSIIIIGTTFFLYITEVMVT